MQVSLIHPDCVRNCWEEVSPLLEKSIDTAHGRYAMDDILGEIVSFDQHLWVVFDDDRILAALTTRFVEYPGKRMLAGQFLGGERIMQWRDKMLTTLERWAKDSKCEGLEMTGRNGFERVLAPHGLTPEYVVFEKMFKEMNNG